ncbi:MAG TPA: hypothetical protein VK186_08185, partial [Candidatus Deferrimicrobium sp.]|nr:hypothetical protein [Candidatus Deferrimicrobium sp.]
KGLFVLIGDANGVDKTVQQYFQEHNYNLVEVFCMEGACRNIGGWPTRSISALSSKKDFSYYSSKDKVMADEASVGFMIWDGKSIGTLTNVFRLISQNKKVVIYTVPAKQFYENDLTTPPFSAKMEGMIERNLKNELKETIESNHSLFLFGPRQTGKTSLLNTILDLYKNVMNYSFLNVALRQRIEKGKKLGCPLILNQGI